MPLKLGISPKTFSSNVSAEMNAGRPQAQSLAIAYSQKRKAERLKRMWRGGYAAGGEVAPGVAPDMQDDDLHVTDHLNTSGEPHTEDDDEVTHPMEFMADGGEVTSDYEDESYDYGPENYSMPGDSTRDVAPGGDRFSMALKRRQRRFGSY